MGRYEEPRGLDGGVAALRPHERGKLLQNGCELWLYQETKVGNMDCTFCMECIHACPHDNVGILTRPPARELWEDPQRAGVGRFSQRPDLAALALFLTFAAFMNAFGMVTPVYALEEWMGRAMGTTSGPLVVGVLFLFGNDPPAGPPCRRHGLGVGRPLSVGANGGPGGHPVRLRPGPVGVRDVGRPTTSSTSWSAGSPSFPSPRNTWPSWASPSPGRRPGPWAPWFPRLGSCPWSCLFLELGLLVSLVVAFRIAVREVGRGPRARRAFAPWGLLALFSLRRRYLAPSPAHGDEGHPHGELSDDVLPAAPPRFSARPHQAWASSDRSSWLGLPGTSRPMAEPSGQPTSPWVPTG